MQINALHENFPGHFCPCLKTANFCHPAGSIIDKCQVTNNCGWEPDEGQCELSIKVFFTNLVFCIFARVKTPSCLLHVSFIIHCKVMGHVLIVIELFH